MVTIEEFLDRPNPDVDSSNTLPGPNTVRTAIWALNHRAELKELIADIASLIDNIETPFPAPQSQLALVKRETAEIQDKQALGLFESAAQDVDSLLQAAAKEALTGHQYLKIVIKGLDWGRI